MSSRGILYDVIAGAWAALTTEQRTCWHFFALKHPVIDEDGELETLNGWQFFYRQNVYIAVSDTYPLLQDPPPHMDPPPTRNLQATLWMIKHLDEDGDTQRRPRLLLEVKRPLDPDTFEIITQTYVTNLRGPPLPAKPQHTQAYTDPSPRHVTIIPADFTGVVDLTEPTGYFATTGGRPKFSEIHGTSAANHPELPAARLISVSLINGQTADATISNARSR